MPTKPSAAKCTARTSRTGAPRSSSASDGSSTRCGREGGSLDEDDSLDANDPLPVIVQFSGKPLIDIAQHREDRIDVFMHPSETFIDITEFFFQEVDELIKSCSELMHFVLQRS